MTVFEEQLSALLRTEGPAVLTYAKDRDDGDYKLVIGTQAYSGASLGEVVKKWVTYLRRRHTDALAALRGTDDGT